MGKATYSLTVGMLHFRWFRQFLRSMQDAGFSVIVYEGPGWLDKVFTIEGEYDQVKSVVDRITLALSAPRQTD